MALWSPPSFADFTVLIIDTGLSSNRTELTKYVEPYFLEYYDDINGHGTHVTSLILRHACPSVKIIPCLYYTGKEEELLERELKCLKTGLKYNVDLVNMSLYGPDKSEEEYKLLKKYEKASIPVHVSLGNDGSATLPAYPADLKLDNLVKIGALNERAFAESSNLRSNAKYFHYRYFAADLSKYGVQVMAGTSQATAYYTGLKVKEYCQKRKKKLTLSK